MSSPMVYSVIALRYFLALNSLFPFSLCLKASLPLFSRFRLAIVSISEGSPPESYVLCDVAIFLLSYNSEYLPVINKNGRDSVIISPTLSGC